MGNICVPLSVSKKTKKSLPIETTFNLPSPLITWPPGEGFATGKINLGEIEVCQISSFQKVWATHEGGADNVGATFFEPSQIPDGFFMLGCYAQSNNTALFGSVLAGAASSGGGALRKPTDYLLVWSSESLKIKQDGRGYIWLPSPPDGYKAVGIVVTNSPEKPSPDKIRCVRSDLTDPCETDSRIWGDANGLINVYSLKPSNRGSQALSVGVGTFHAQINNSPTVTSSIACLKNLNSNYLSAMPNLKQINAIVEAYSPFIYFHPDETYLPSSVTWFFTNGALLYKNGEQPSKPVKIEPTGSNLPQGGSNDGAYWLDLPVDEAAKNKVKKGDLQSSQAYLHIKPTFGGTFTDIAIWVFYPFNGPARAKVELINLSLGKIGEHVGDWEHLTLRVSNFNGILSSIYFSQHSGGTWVSAADLEFQSGGNKAVAYSSLSGHAMYSKPGLVLQGSGGIGIRNDAAKSKMVMDTGAGFLVVAAEYLGADVVAEPPWLNYCRKWGPKISYDLAEELKKVEKVLPGKLKSVFERVVKSLPNEVLGEEGPTGPKMKSSWSGDEV